MNSSAENSSDDSRDVSFTRKEIFEFIKPVLNGKINVLVEMIEDQVTKKLEHPYILPLNKKKALKTLVSEFRIRWQQVNKIEKRFFQRFATWLKVPVLFETEIEESTTSAESAAGKGRPLKGWDNLSDKSKRRRTDEIRKQYSVEELAYATQMGLRAAGKVEASKIIRDVTEGSPSMASKYREAMEHVPERVLTGDEVLSFVVGSELTKRGYQLLRSTAIMINCKAWPAYFTLSDAKKRCYPDKSEMSITKNAAAVGLQALLDHTAERLLLSQSDVIKSIPEDKLAGLEFTCNWGGDGTSSRRTRKRKLGDEDGEKSDVNLFFISLVPLQLYDKVNPKEIIWQNPRPSSPRFCRPLKIGFSHETAETSTTEIDRIEEQVKKLVPYETVLDGRKIKIHFKLVLTMIDDNMRKYRRDFLRKFYQAKTMEDVLCRLLITSDPLISSLHTVSPKKPKSSNADQVELVELSISPSVRSSRQNPPINLESDESEDDSHFTLIASDSE